LKIILLYIRTGTVATGRYRERTGEVGEEVEIVGIKPTRKSVVARAWKCSRKLLDSGMAGDNVGLLLRGVERKEIERWQVISKPGSITSATRSSRRRYTCWTKKKGEDHTPFFSGYRPQFLLSYDGRNGSGDVERRSRDGDAGDNSGLVIEFDRADRDGEGVEVCDSRRRTDGRSGNGRRDYRVVRQSPTNFSLSLTSWRSYAKRQTLTLQCTSARTELT